MKHKYGVVKAVKYQTGKKSNLAKDRARKALHAGKRRSKSGKLYSETRRNRSDLHPTTTHL